MISATSYAGALGRFVAVGMGGSFTAAAADWTRAARRGLLLKFKAGGRSMSRRFDVKRPVCRPNPDAEGRNESPSRGLTAAAEVDECDGGGEPQREQPGGDGAAALPRFGAGRIEGGGEVRRAGKVE